VITGNRPITGGDRRQTADKGVPDVT